jgi:hypothetical protein
VPAQVQQLIDKFDSFELVRDQIAAILKTESDGQKSLAVAAGKDPSLWALRVFTERSSPWQAFKDDDCQPPIINVWFENASPNRSSSNVISHQEMLGTFHVDCYGQGVDQRVASGQRSADDLAAREAHRAARLVRNILMSGYYTLLGFPMASEFTPEQKAAGERQIVMSRFPGATTVFQPTQDEQPVSRVCAVRFDLEVTYNETSQEYQGVPLELLALTMQRTEDQEWFSAEYDLTA